MLSQEEYLDSLLKEFIEGGQISENGTPKKGPADTGNPLEGISADLSTDIPMDDLTDLLTDVPADPSTDIPMDDLTDLLTDVPADLSTDIPMDNLTDFSTDVPTDLSADLSTDVPMDNLTDFSTDVPMDLSAYLSTDVSMELFGDPTKEEETESFPKNAELKENYDIQDTMNMSSENIERILAENAGRSEQSEEKNEPSDDLEALLNGMETDLKDIQDLLHKADNNEPVDEDVFALLEQLENVDSKEDEKPNTEPEKEGRKKSFAEKIKEKKKAREAAKKEKAEKKAKKEAEKEEKKKESSVLKSEDRTENTDTGNADTGDTGTENAGIGEDSGENVSVEQAGKEEIPEDRQEQKEDLLEKNADPEAEPESNYDTSQDSDSDNDSKDSLQNGIGAYLGTADDLFSEMEDMNALGGADGSDMSGMGDDPDKPGVVNGLEELKKEKSARKKGLFARILEMLTEEEEEKEEDQELILSDENEAILKELNKENKKKDKTKGKKKKGKVMKSESSEEAEEETGKKEKEPKKPKKVKEPKPQKVEESGKKLSKKRVFLIFMICITIGASILILGTVTVDFADKKKAAAAFYEGDYEECYQYLTGKSLNESQRVMYGKSESILRMRLWMREYEWFVEEGQEPEALDSLMQSVHDYPVLQAFSGKWNATLEVQEIYEQMLEILQKKYGISEEVAKSIANEKDDLKYSQMVRTIASGGEYKPDGQPEADNSQETGKQPETMEDILPEEEEIKDTEFAD